MATQEEGDSPFILNDIASSDFKEDKWPMQKKLIIGGSLAAIIIILIIVIIIIAVSSSNSNKGVSYCAYPHFWQKKNILKKIMI